MLTKLFGSIKKCMMLEIIDKNVFGIKTLPNNLLIILRFRVHDLVFCLLSMVFKISVSCQNMVRENFNQNLKVRTTNR